MTGMTGDDVEMLVRVALVAVGGAIGAASRYLLGAWIAARVGPDFPWGTFAINVSGALLIGVVLGLAAEGIISSEAQVFLAVGVLGGYTTFSTFSYESFGLLTDGNIGAFLLNAVGQLGAGLLAVALGLALSRVLGVAR